MHQAKPPISGPSGSSSAAASTTTTNATASATSSLFRPPSSLLTKSLTTLAATSTSSSSSVNVSGSSFLSERASPVLVSTTSEAADSGTFTTSAEASTKTASGVDNQDKVATSQVADENIDQEREHPQDQRDRQEEEEETQTYPERRYYILSSAGKPIYISHLATQRATLRSNGDCNDGNQDEEEKRKERLERIAQEDDEEEQATTQVGVMQALISIFADQDNDKLRYITADEGRTRITFLLRSPIYLVCVSSWGEPVTTTRTHLEYLYLQVISLVSAEQLQRLFSRMPNFDLRRLLDGTDSLFSSLLSRMQQVDLSFQLEALQPVRLDSSLRDSLASALTPTNDTQRPRDLLYVVLLANSRIVTLVRPRKHSVHPIDMHLLINTVYGSDALCKSGADQSWVPICLPKFAPQGFVHAFIQFLTSPLHSSSDAAANAAQVALVVVTGNREGFSQISSWVSTSIVPNLPFSLLFSALSSSLSTTTNPSPQVGCSYSATDLGIPGLRHFIYKSNNLLQITSTQLESPYDQLLHSRRLSTLYNLLHDAIHSQHVKMKYLQTQHEAVLGWITQPFEIYLTFHHAISKSSIVLAANTVVRWVKNQEQNLFVCNSVTF